ncbi:MAG TPA: NAD-dependent epimerase/dehydratase family protein [Acetobacteraceae bacterium]|nr:NAD-dependent epimerase/dehydratase family protein [Acetobacteraceae bacterium]
MEAGLAGIDACFHLAAVASVARGVEDWLGTHRANLTGTITLFDTIRRERAGIPVVYASSAAVYGDCQVVPISETAPRRPQSAYGADKYACELHALVASHVHHVPMVGLRFFNVYGPRQDPRSPYSGVISIFCERLRRGAPIEIFGDGHQARDFIYVGDVVASLRAAMALRPDDAPAFNVCTGVATSVLGFAQLIAMLSGVAATIRHAAPRAGEIRESVGTPALARGVLGLGPPLALRDGLRHVLDWLDAAA